MVEESVFIIRSSLELLVSRKVVIGNKYDELLVVCAVLELVPFTDGISHSNSVEESL